MKTGLTIKNIFFIVMLTGVNIAYGQLGDFQGAMIIIGF